jgi:hypothetical protein
MDDSADDKAAVGVDSLSLIVPYVFIGDPVFTATTALPVFFTNVSPDDRPELPESMRHFGGCAADWVQDDIGSID